MKLGIPWKTGHAVAKTGDTSFALLLININANMKLEIPWKTRRAEEKTGDISFAILVMNIKTNMKQEYLIHIITDQR